MDKRTLFLLAMKQEEFRRRAWVFTAFSLTQEDKEAWTKLPYAYRLVATPTGYFFVDPNNNNQLTIVEDAIPGQPLYGIKEHLLISAGDVPNLDVEIDTTYGRLLANYAVLVYPFGNKIPYINYQKWKPGMLESLIIDRLRDTPENDTDREQPGPSSAIYVDEYLKFTNALFYLAGFSQLCVPAATRKTMTAAPGIAAFKAQLIEEYKDRLHDPATIAKIDAELVKFDRAYLKGDEGEGFLIKDKAFNIVRKKLFGMLGAEVGLEEKVNVDLIKNSLEEGWDVSAFPAMNNSLRAGSFNRGANTMLGGELVKWLMRASSNIVVSDKIQDCGSRLGNVIKPTDKTYKKLIGFSVVTESGSIRVPDAETAKTYIGKKIMLRSPMYCKLDKTDYCSCCVGDRLAASPKGISSAITEYGSIFLNIFMSAGHSKGLMLAEMDIKTAIF